MQSYFLILVLFFCTLFLKAQELVSPIDSFRFYGDAMFSLKIVSNKIFAERQFLRLATQLIQENKDSALLSFHPSFIATESFDKELKIISWQIDEAYQSYHYCAYLFSNSSKPVFIKSTDRNLNRIQNEVFSNENWYGAMYYHFLPEKLNGFYTLFGYRFSNDGIKHRIIDLLKIDDGQIELGSPLFKKIDSKGLADLEYRHVIHYSPSANVVLRYEEDSKMIFFDHVDKFTDPKSGDLLLVPDGTFEAFELKDGYWNYIPYQKGEMLESAPREKPVLGKDTKDLFGKEKKK